MTNHFNTLLQVFKGKKKVPKVPCSFIMSCPGTMAHDWFTKLGGTSSHSWKLRFFVLHYHLLFYFKNAPTTVYISKEKQTSTQQLDEELLPLGVINLYQCQIEGETISYDSSLPLFRITLRVSKDKNKRQKYCLETNIKTQFDHWKQLLTQVGELKPSQIIQDVRHFGWIHKLSKKDSQQVEVLQQQQSSVSSQSWKLRFFILRNNCLYYYVYNAKNVNQAFQRGNLITPSTTSSPEQVQSARERSSSSSSRQKNIVLEEMSSRNRSASIGTNLSNKIEEQEEEQQEVSPISLHGAPGAPMNSSPFPQRRSSLSSASISSERRSSLFSRAKNFLMHRKRTSMSPRKFKDYNSYQDTELLIYFALQTPKGMIPLSANAKIEFFSSPFAQVLSNSTHSNSIHPQQKTVPKLYYNGTKLKNMNGIVISSTIRVGSTTNGIRLDKSMSNTFIPSLFPLPPSQQQQQVVTSSKQQMAEEASAQLDYFFKIKTEYRKEAKRVFVFKQGEPIHKWMSQLQQTLVMHWSQYKKQRIYQLEYSVPHSMVATTDAILNRQDSIHFESFENSSITHVTTNCRETLVNHLKQILKEEQTCFRNFVQTNMELEYRPIKIELIASNGIAFQNVNLQIGFPIQFEAKGNVLFTSSSFEEPIFTIQGNDASVHLKGLQFRMRGFDDLECIVVCDGANLILEKCSLSSEGMGVHVTQHSECLCLESLITDCSIGFKATQLSHLRIEKCKFTKNSQMAIKLEFSSTLYLYQSQIKSNQNGIVLDSSTYETKTNLHWYYSLINNYIARNEEEDLSGLEALAVKGNIVQSKTPRIK